MKISEVTNKIYGGKRKKFFLIYGRTIFRRVPEAQIIRKKMIIWD